MLTPCGACARHVRVDENACPFCGAGREAKPIVPPADPAGNRSFRFGRLAIVTAGAALAAAAVGCIESSVTPMYGMPCGPDNCGYDAGEDARLPADASLADAADGDAGDPDAGDAGDAGDPDAGDAEPDASDGG